jgi:hypothetical protein
MMRSAEGADTGEDVLLIKRLDAEPRRGRLAQRAQRRPRRAEPGHTPPDPVPITRVTVIASPAFADERAAREWLEACRGAEATARELDYAVRRVNRAVHAHRLSTGDPYVSDVSVAQARRARLGYGTGDELVEGTWSDAWTVSEDTRARARRRAILAPQEQVAMILGGHKPPFASEDLLLRARLDLAEGRPRQAALQARVAEEALRVELAEPAQPAQGASEPIGRIAAAALERPLDAGEVAELDEMIAEMERVVRRRRHL